MPRPGTRALAALLLLPLLLAARCDSVDLVVGVLRTDGTLPLALRLQQGQDPDLARIWLDGVEVTDAFAPASGTLVGAVPLPPPGTSTLRVESVIPSGVAGLSYTSTWSFPLDVPAPAPELVRFDPLNTGGRIAASSWLRLRFADVPAPASRAGPAFGIECDGATQERRLHAVADAVILDPTPSLPAGAACRVAWRGPDGGVEEFVFETAAAGTPVRVLHDREDPALVAPFPDDFFLEQDAATATGLRIAIPEPPYSGTLGDVYRALLGPVGRLDGFSRVAHALVVVDAAIDRGLAPSTAAESADPFAPIALFDLDPASPEHGHRIPYTLQVRDDVNSVGQVDRSLAIYPGIALRPRGRYALVVTRRLFARNDPSRPLSPSPFFERVAEEPTPSDSDAVLRARSTIAPLLDWLEAAPAVPIPREDVALALSFSIRSDDEIPDDLLAIKQDALASPPPELTITSVNGATDGAVIRGTVALPSYQHPVFATLARDAGGRPVRTGTDAVPFVLRLPAAASTPAPIVLYQHGNPGSPEEVTRFDLNGYHWQNGFAVGGIRDTLNRKLGEIDAQVAATFFFLLQTREVPAYWTQTGSDMIHWLRALQGLGDRDWLPLGAPDGVPDLDPSRLFYHGISEGGNNALRFLPYAPEILAATPTVGGGRLVQTLLHQFPALLDDLESFVGDVRPAQLLVGLSLFQHAYDAQDPHSYARFLYRDPLVIPGLAGARPPSVLWTEGVNDGLVPNAATRSAARELGIPTMRPVLDPSPVLTEVDGPLRGNLGDRTAAHFQYRSELTPACGAGEDGHYCPQYAPEAHAQRLHFLESALHGPPPEIVDPFAEP